MGFLEGFKKKIQEAKNLKKQELFECVREIISQVAKIEDKERIKLESRFQEDLGLDSLDALEIIMSLEREFDFEIPDEDIEKIQSVEQIVNYLLTRLK